MALLSHTQDFLSLFLGEPPSPCLITCSAPSLCTMIVSYYFSTNPSASTFHPSDWQRWEAVCFLLPLLPPLPQIQLPPGDTWQCPLHTGSSLRAKPFAKTGVRGASRFSKAALLFKEEVILEASPRFTWGEFYLLLGRSKRVKTLQDDGNMSVR